LSQVLLIAEAANPEWVSVPLIGWSLARAISAKIPAHLVTHVRNRDAILRAGLVEGRDFTAIDSERFAAPSWKIANAIRGGRGVGWTTISAITLASYYYFEWLVWKRFGDAISRQEFDLVHRITPISPTVPSILAKRCSNASTPFVLGPLNGGIPWPKDFSSIRRKEREWLSYVRSAYKLLPAYRSTLTESSAIIAGSRSALSNIPQRFRSKCIYIPENAVDLDRFPLDVLNEPSDVLRACFVGRLVPYKGPDMLLEAVAPLLRSGRLQLDIIGDGPLMPGLQAFSQANDLESAVTFHGWISHNELRPVMRKSQLLLFPSIREFGGGVVLEAMALGIIPVVVDYGGPAELVTNAVGFKIDLGPRNLIVDRLRATVTAICDEPGQLRHKSAAARLRVRDLFTWDVKARQIIEIYDWIRATRMPSSETLLDGKTINLPVPDFSERKFESDSGESSPTSLSMVP
jgi:glycosyltransferase involved in cell wall biosynthesis